jgi:hypothetical protein
MYVYIYICSCLLKEVKRDLKRIHIDGCRCDDRLNARTEVATPRLHWVVRVKHTVMLMGGTRPGRTHKKPKNLSACDREERGRGEGGVCMFCACVNEVHWNLEGAGWQEHSRLSDTRRYIVWSLYSLL